MGGDLGEASDVGEDERLAEREGGEQDAGLVDLAVREDDEVGAAEERGDLGVVDEARDEADAGRRVGGQVDAERAADDPQLGVLDPPPRLEQDVEALVRAQEPEEQDDGLVDRGELGRQRRLVPAAA